MTDAIRYASLILAIVVALLLLARPTWGFLGLILLLPFLNRFIPKAGPGLNAETFLFAIAILGALLWMRPALPKARDTLPMLAYVGCVLFGFAVLMTHPPQIMAQIDKFESLMAVKAELWPILLFFIAYALTPTPEDRRRAMNLLSIPLAIFCINGLIDARTGADVGERFHRAAGVLAKNPNVLGGGIAILTAFPLIGMTSREVSKRWRLFHAGVYVLALVTLVSTQSRGSWLGFTIGHAVWLGIVNWKLLPPAAIGGFLLGSLLYSANLLPAAIMFRIEHTLRPATVQYQSGLQGTFDSSIGIRLAYHQVGLQMFMDSPLWGHGYRSFRLLAKPYGASIGLVRNQMGAESILISVAVGYGLIGLAIMAWMTWLLLAYALSLARRGEEERDLGLAFMYMWGAIGIMNLTLNALYVHEIALPFWIAAGMAARAVRDRETARAQARQPAWRQLSASPAMLGPQLD